MRALGVLCVLASGAVACAESAPFAHGECPDFAPLGFEPCRGDLSCSYTECEGECRATYEWNCVEGRFSCSHMDDCVAIDHIPEAACVDPDGEPLTTDQHGEPRPETGGMMCDIGAFEVQP